jgi:hypothetical protein
MKLYKGYKRIGIFTNIQQSSLLLLSSIIINVLLIINCPLMTELTIKQIKEEKKRKENVKKIIMKHKM